MNSTDKQQKCIYALCMDKGVSFDKNAVKQMSKEQASKFIDELRANPKVETVEEVPPTKLARKFNQWRFGMCVKLVLEHGMKFDEAVSQPDRFKELLGKVYHLVESIEQDYRMGTAAGVDTGCRIPATVPEQLKYQRGG